MPRKVNGHIAEVTEKNIENILCTEEQRRKKNSRPYRIIARVTRACGTVGFLLANAAVFAGWVLVNELVVEFDPYPIPSCSSVYRWRPSSCPSSS